VPLPKIVTQEFSLELPSTGKSIKYRPFLVKEEKILLIALESKDVKQITSAIKQILKACILTRNIKVEELPTFDIEYIFLNVRGKSVGESIDLIVTCADDGETQVPVTIFIDQIQVVKNPNHTQDISLGSDLILRMKYPSLEEFINNNFEFTQENSVANIDRSLEIISSCMDVVFSEDESWSAKDCSKKELMDYIETMTNSQFSAIENFFQTMPVLSYEFEVVNPKTKVKNAVQLKGLTSFFT